MPFYVKHTFLIMKNFCLRKGLIGHYIKLFFLLIFMLRKVNARKECVSRQVPEADTVCVCNATYCDDFPPLQKPKSGYASVYESSKSGIRFKETLLKVETSHTTSNASKIQTVVIDETHKYQKIFGFGGAFTDSVGLILNSVPKSLADHIMESYFSVNGLEYNMGRVPMAGTDYSVRHYSYDDTKDDKNLTHFLLPKEDLEWKIPYIKQAQKLSPHPLKLFGNPWLAPDWVKTNITLNQLKGEVGGEYYQIWAHYFVKFLDAYSKEHNITMWGITVQNEPSLGRKYPGDGLYYEPEMERDFIKMNLGPTLHKSGYTSDKLKLMMYDDNVHMLDKWADTILKDKEAAQYVSGIAFHWYSNSRTSEWPDILLDNIHNKYPNHFLLSSEACHLEGVGTGRWDFGEHYAHDIIRDLNNWVTGWVDWNFVLDKSGGHQPTKDKNAKGGFSSPIYIDTEAKEAYKQPMFYMLGHFSKFISPDSVRIGHKLEKQVDNLFVLTIKRPDNATVVVVLNQNNEEIELNINDSKNHFSHKLAPHSIQTYIWW